MRIAKRPLWLGLTSLALLSMLAAAFVVFHGTSHAEDQPVPQSVTHQHFNFLEGVITPQTSDGVISESNYKNPPSPICSTDTSDAANVNTDCEGNAPHNETTIAVNPTNPNNIIMSANDYQLKVSSGGTVNETTYSRAHVTFDGGKTWTTYPIDYHGYYATGDPALSFDASGTAYLATLGFVWSQGGPTGTNPDILVAHSTDGGKTWSAPSRTASGKGSWGSTGVFNDKEFLTAWGDGNAIVTWTVFNQGPGGSYINSPIYASVTHDGGKTWSAGSPISGSASFCVGVHGDNACDQDQGSVPTVGADGNIYVAFINTSDTSTGRDQYLVVKVDPTTGQKVSGPYQVSKVYDGFHDYPISGGRQTYQDSQFRTWAVGNITADPSTPGHLAVVWSDMRNSTLPAPTDPYTATTNSDIIVSESNDGGQTWSAPTAIVASGDQFMPWGAYDASGTLHIGYFDRSYDPANHKYGYTLATETGPGTFATAQVSTALSDPTQGDRWFSGGDAPRYATSFLGDYSGIAVTPSGGVVASWTDMRNSTTFGTRTGSGEDEYFGKS